VIWLWGLTVGLLLGAVLGLVLARWPYRRREQRGQAGSVTDLGERFALVNELRREITRLRQATARLQADRWLRSWHATVHGLDRLTAFLRQAHVPTQEIERAWRALATRRVHSIPRVELTPTQIEALGL
jgi:hypothetical protein